MTFSYLFFLIHILPLLLSPVALFFFFFFCSTSVSLDRLLTVRIKQINKRGELQGFRKEAGMRSPFKGALLGECCKAWTAVMKSRIRRILEKIISMFSIMGGRKEEKDSPILGKKWFF